MASKKGKILGVSIGLLTLITAAIIVNRVIKKRAADKILDDIEKGKGESGNWSDLGTDDALDPNYHLTINRQTCKKSQAYLDKSVAMLDKNTHLYRPSDEKAVLAEIKKYRSKEQTSQLADAFQKETGDDLYDRLRNIDATILRLKYGSQYMPKINSHIKKIPNYVSPPCKG